MPFFHFVRITNVRKLHSSCKTSPIILTEHFNILKPQNLPISEFYLIRKRRLMDFEATKCLIGLVP